MKPVPGPALTLRERHHRGYVGQREQGLGRRATPIREGVLRVGQRGGRVFQNPYLSSFFHYRVAILVSVSEKISEMWS